MHTVLNEVLLGKESNYMMPFFWMRDNHHDQLRARVRSVYRSGCRALCVESRTHEDFCGKTWWEDMDDILSEAEKLGMQVWILDDKHFPTGMANEIIKNKYPEKRKWHLREYHVDVYGEMKGATLFVRPAPAEDVLLGIFAIRRTGEGEVLSTDILDITDKLSAGRVRFDVPAGVWRVFFLYKTRDGAVPAHANYIHLIDEESVSALIEAVYEPHYERYARYFGNTIQGFFSDEPQFGNTYLNWRGEIVLSYGKTLGLPGQALPWSDLLLEKMSGHLKEDALRLLAALWYPMEGTAARVRYAYMDEVTKLWRSAFSMQLGAWCKNHNVDYIGHIIEDMNAHARLGYSAGHYFRALDGQHMAGIDVVLHQIMPGMSHMIHTASCAGGRTDPAFFNYVLAKLASSHAHIQPQKQGRAMCEVFGAYGWAEGVPFMKRLMDHMLVRGINRYVPHAFSPDYPDRDCPPHFGLYDIDPQAKPFEKLMKYSNQICHLFEGAVHEADVAILYHAELEWFDNDRMGMETIAEALYTHQIDYDIIPLDVLKEAKVENGRLLVHKESYGALYVPGVSKISDEVSSCLAALSEQGLPVIFAGRKPEGMPGMRCVETEAIAESAKPFANISLAPAMRDISIYRAVRDGLVLMMLVNESEVSGYEGRLHAPYAGSRVKMNILTGEVWQSAQTGEIDIRLAPGESCVIAFGNELPEAKSEKPMKESLLLGSENGGCEWEIAISEPEKKDDFRIIANTETLFDITQSDERAAFSGFVRYKAKFHLENASLYHTLSLGEVGMTAQVSVNGKAAGETIAAPHVLTVENLLKDGENEIEIIAANSLAGKVRDNFSTYVQVPRTGLLGPVKLFKC